MKNEYLVFRLKPGDDLYEGIVAECVNNRLHAGAVISAVGCVQKVSLRTADGQTIFHQTADYEVTALSGTISSDGLHLHIGLCDADLRCIGGHLQVGTIVNTTMEIVIVNLEKEYELSRSHDETTGYDELVVQRK